MKENTSKTWIEVCIFDFMNGKKRGIEISTDFYFRTYEVNDNRPEHLLKSTIKYSELKLLTPEQQTLIKEKRSKVNFKTLKNEYYDSNVIDGGTVTFQITEENFSKTIQETNFSWKGTEYEPLAKFIHYLYDLYYREN